MFGPMRTVSGGNHSDGEVCEMLGILWEAERERVGEVGLACRPQWVGARLNQIMMYLLCLGWSDLLHTQQPA